MPPEIKHWQTILDLLGDFSLDSLKDLLWTELGYPRVVEPLSRRAWPEPLRKLLAEDPVVLSRVGEGGGFRVIYCLMQAPRLSLTEERAVITRLLHDHPYALFVFSDGARQVWHLVNVKIAVPRDAAENRDVARRKVFRRIAIAPGELNRTGAEQLAFIDTRHFPDGDETSPLAIQEIHDRAFDVEKVTKAFYDTYREVFEHVEASIEGFADEAARRLFTQRLFHRLMFVAFVQKKGWLEFEGARKDYLLTLWGAYGAREEPQEDDSFYRDRLLRLYQDILNRTPEMLSVASDGFVQQLVGRGPYLNGGLFAEDALDRTPGLRVPDAAIEEILFDLFETYNFTITEATPVEVEVAVDPEMLGKVFEKLVTYRHDTGSYYTPKVVVSFMCREALKGYLRTVVPQEAADALARFVDLHEADGLKDGEAILHALREVRVCDPACGSGAYLVGMLHELLDLRAALFATSSLGTESIFDRKLEIIQNNLFGVDVDTFAVDTARMRLWLSLVVDFDDGGDYTRVPPLPNLTFKIERGDSLSVPRPVVLGLAAEASYRAQQLKNEYLTAHGHEATRILNEVESALAALDALSLVHATGDGFNWWVRFSEVFTEPPAASGVKANGGNGATARGAGFDIVLANPPYGAEVGDAIRDLYFERGREGAQSKDTYGLFIARGLELLRPGGYLSYIVSDTWRTLRSHRPLRARLVDQTRVHHLLDLPSWIFDATVNTGIVNLRVERCGDDHALRSGDLRALPRGAGEGWEGLALTLTKLSGTATDEQSEAVARYTYRQQTIKVAENRPFFIGSPSLFVRCFDGGLPRLGTLAEVRVGLQTGDNPAYIRKSPSVQGKYEIVDPERVLTAAELAALDAAEKREGLDPGRHGGRRFVPYDKGGESAAHEGWLPNYHVPTGYFIDWSRESVHRLRTLTVADVNRGRGKRVSPADEKRIASRFQNAEFYFREGITFSDTGVYAPTFRRSAGSVFDQKGSVIIPNPGVDRDFLLGVLCSRWARYVYKTYINHTVSTHVDSIKELPIRLDGNEVGQIAGLVRCIVARQQAEPRYSYHLHEQKEIDALVYSLYGLSPGDVSEIELWFRRRYPALAA